MSSPQKSFQVRFAPYAPSKPKIETSSNSQVQVDSEEAQVLRAFFKLQASGLCNMLEAPKYIKRRFPELSDEVIEAYHMRYMNDYESLQVLYSS
jgi:hypothetical protein